MGQDRHTVCHRVTTGSGTRVAVATRRIFLHIGAMKTGTTYIQTVLSENRERLIEEGVLFPGERWRSQVRAVEDVLRLSKKRDGRPTPTPATLAGPGRGDPVLRRRHGGRVHGVALVRAPCPGAVDRVVTGTGRGPGGAHAPGRDAHGAGGLADRRAQRIDGLVAPVRPWGPSRAALPVDLGAVRAAGGDADVRPQPGRPLHPAVLGGAAGSRSGSTWSRCLPRGIRRSSCGPGSRRRSGSLRSCAGLRSHRPTRPWDWRRPSCSGW